MVWYDAAVGDYVAMSPEWGGSAVGVGRTRAAAVEAFESLVSRLESAGNFPDAEPARYPPTTLAPAVERERERLARGAGPQGAAPRTSAGRRRPVLTPS